MQNMVRLDLLREERRKRKLSQAHIAEALNISRNAYCMKECGKAGFSLEDVAIIRDLLGLPDEKVKEIFGV